jgi:ankyrin repeat protein
MAEAKPKDEVLAAATNAAGGDDDDDEENQVEELKQEQKDEFLLKACKEDNLEEAQVWLSKQASPICEKDGWNPLLWAASNGNEDIVRLLIKHNACAPYLSAATAANAEGDGAMEKAQSQQIGDEEYDPFVKPKDA